MRVRFQAERRLAMFPNSIGLVGQYGGNMPAQYAVRLLAPVDAPAGTPRMTEVLKLMAPPGSGKENDAADQTQAGPAQELGSMSCAHVSSSVDPPLRSPGHWAVHLASGCACSRDILQHKSYILVDLR